MDKNQNADRPQNQAKLICLLIRHCNLPADSDQQPSLVLEIIAAENGAPKGARDGPLLRSA
jgi:hypothetical protein